MQENNRYGWVLILVLLLQPVSGSSQTKERDDPSTVEGAASRAESVTADVASQGDTPVVEAPSPNGDVPLEPATEPTGRERARRTGGPLKVPEHVSLRLNALSKHLDALAEKGNTAIYNGLLSLALGGASVALGVFVDDPSLPTYLYVFGSIHAVRGITGMLLVPDPDSLALRYAQMSMASVRDVKRRLRFGGFSLDRLASRNRWARYIDGTLLVSAGALAVPLLLIRDDFAFDTALDYFVVAGAGLSLLVGTATLLMPTEAEKRYDSYLAARHRIKRQWQRKRRRVAASPSFRAALLPTWGGAAVLARISF